MRIPWSIILCGLCCSPLLFTGLVRAQDHPEHPKKGPEHPAKGQPKGKVIVGKVTGESICLGCALKGQGAAAQCDKFGHRHALRVISVNADGKELAEFKGSVLHYLDTDNAQPFIQGKQSGKLTVQGKVYAAERVIEVTTAQATEKTEPAKKPEHPEHPKDPKKPEHPEHPKKP